MVIRLRSNKNMDQYEHGVYPLVEYPETLRNQNRHSGDFDDSTFKQRVDEIE